MILPLVQSVNNWLLDNLSLIIERLDYMDKRISSEFFIVPVFALRFCNE